MIGNRNKNNRTYPSGAREICTDGRGIAQSGTSSEHCRTDGCNPWGCCWIHGPERMIRVVPGAISIWFAWGTIISRGNLMNNRPIRMCCGCRLRNCYHNTQSKPSNLEKFVVGSVLKESKVKKLSLVGKTHLATYCSSVRPVQLAPVTL